MITNLTPALQMTGIDVLSYDNDTNIMNVIFYAPSIYNDVTRVQHFNKSIKTVVKYMETEGFILPNQNWKCNVGVVLH